MLRDQKPAADRRWVERTPHRLWLLGRADALFSFFEAGCRNPLGGYFELDEAGRPLAPGADGGLSPSRNLHITTRLVHAFGIASLMGRPGADTIVDQGMDFLWNGHRDATNGGYHWGVGYGTLTDPTKQAYGHAHVLLAAATARAAGHPDADRLLADVTDILVNRFWETQPGAVAEEFTADWRPIGDYRGQNSNMHLTESLMAAFEVTDEADYLRRAESIAELIVDRFAAHNGWRLPEHFDGKWNVKLDYVGNPMFKPYGSTPGHWLEWARLLLQLWELGGRKLGWLPDAAQNLFRLAVGEGWDQARGGFHYTVGWDGQPSVPDRFWWPCCEGIGAAHFLASITGDAFYEDWYRRIWDFTSDHLIDRTTGAFIPQLDAENRPATNPFYGRPDIYHSVQACLIPLLPTSGSLVRGLMTEGVKL
jgi:mannose/cellobiose epimerase-like protein (N-acyl-D-glucosamine 2-epimerase family)